MASYDFKEVEKKWVGKYDGFGGFHGKDFESMEKKYILVEFPYPSGEGLHVGHAFSMTGSDVYARFLRMQGKNVMFPMGWDAFGLPTENFAIKMGVNPVKVTKNSTDKFREQMRRLALSFDWEREVNTTDPDYYKWTQWIFTKLFEKGLAEKKEMAINWCPSCLIGLANEEVVDGKCERCGSETERRTISQWVVKITKYADRLLEGLAKTNFIDKVKAAQTNWIDKRDGAKIRFTIKDSEDVLEVFTTRADTLMGVTFMVIAPEHKLVAELMGNEAVKKYVTETKKKSEMERTELSEEKTGVFSGLYAINPISEKEIPVWIADYVLVSYGTGAIMAVPAHDERDFEFAKKFNLEIAPVIMPERLYVDEKAKGYYAARQNKNKEYLILLNKIASENRKSLLVNGGWAATIQVGYEYRECEDIDISILKGEKEWWNEQFIKNGFEVDPIFGQSNPDEYYQAVRKLENEVDTNIDIDVVEKTDDYELKVFEGQQFLVEAKKLIIEKKLDELKSGKEKRWKEDADFMMLSERPFLETANGLLINSQEWNGLTPDEAAKKIIVYLSEKGVGEKAVNYHLRDWIFSRQHYWGEPIPMVKCPVCGWVSVPLEQLPVKLPEVEKYQPTNTGESPLAGIALWVNVECPKCGGNAKRETDTMPNWAGSDWYFLRYCDSKNENVLADVEKMKYWMPVDVYVGGDEHNTLHLLYSRFIYQFLWDLGVVPKNIPEPYDKRLSHGVILGADGNRMSKSAGNVIIPDAVADVYGTDVLRTYMMFMGPFDSTMAWNERSLVGVRRFIERLYGLVIESKGKYATTSIEGMRVIHRLVKGVGTDVAGFKFNTAIAKMMEAVNDLTKNKIEIADIELSMIVRILAPFAPFVAEELWNVLGGEFSVHVKNWPEIDEKYLISESVTLSVQVNGKLRGTVELTPSASEEEVKEAAEAQEKVSKYLSEGTIKKVIYVKGKTINFVVD